jgi:hypothetical protein
MSVVKPVQYNSQSCPNVNELVNVTLFYNNIGRNKQKKEQRFICTHMDSCCVSITDSSCLRSSILRIQGIR